MKTLSYRFVLQRTATLLAVVALTLVLLAGLTGILLAFYYDPTAPGAFDSLQYITEEVTGGVLVRSLHNLAGNGIIVVALLQIIVMFLGRQFRPSWLTGWISGILLTLVAIGLGWTAMILNWDQDGYWRLKIELGIIETIPVIGDALRDILTGGSISSVTVEHMYALHSYILSGVSVALSVVHLGALVYQEQERREVRKRLDEISDRATPSQAQEDRNFESAASNI